MTIENYIKTYCDAKMDVFNAKIKAGEVKHTGYSQDAYSDTLHFRDELRGIDIDDRMDFGD